MEKQKHTNPVRIVMNAAGGVVQASNYYPSGVTMAELPRRTDPGVQSYKFGGKELDRSYGLDAYDFEARPYNPVLMRFTGVDPLASKYPAISPFAYCWNNPVNRVDPTGMDIIVLNAPKGASGFGHTAILVGNSKDGWTYISKDGSKWLPMNGPSKYTNTQKTGKIFYSEDDFNKSDYASKFGDGYTQRVKFGTTGEQDKKAIDAADNAAKRWYSMFFDNCVDAVSEALEAAGFNPGYTWFGMDNPYAGPITDKSPIPNHRFQKIAKNNKADIYNTDNPAQEDNNTDSNMIWNDVWNTINTWLQTNPNITVHYY